MKKIRSRSGETITETLVSLLIITLVFVFLASAVVTSARANETFSQKDITFRIDGAPQDKGKISVVINQTVDGESKTVSIEAREYHVDSGNREEGYDYYEYQETVPAP